MNAEKPADAASSDPVIDAYKSGIDVTLIRENLRRSPEQRIRNLQQLQEFAEELRKGGREMRKYSPASGVEMSMHRFLVIVEEAGQNYSAYSPDLPGCVATGSTRDEAEKNMYEAIQLHIEGLREDGLPIPSSTSIAEYLVVGA